jgi:hypothetical protein
MNQKILLLMIYVFKALLVIIWFTFLVFKTSTMAADEPLEVENWVRERVLGSGGFGQVTLWRHKTKDEMIGEVQLNLYQMV